MGRAAIQRSFVAGVAALSLAFLAGCSDFGGTESGKGASEVAVEGSKAPALSVADLEKAALKDGDVEGHKVTEPTLTVEQKDVEADDQACLPVAYAAMGTVVDAPGATVQRETASEPDALAAKDDPSSVLHVTRNLIRLSSYEGESAQAAMDSLSKSADACAKGFKVTADGADQQVTKVAKTTAPQGADQAIALDVITEVEGDKVPLQVVVIRKGSILGYFTALNLGSFATGKDFDFPTEVVDAQLVKLA
ncbi:sensor domain-containing protein [Streptomyces fulvoviolaceus]|uniref:sensor domain-containing protein n=1 Tax=Streptomyces fulvoviolaceus TaxID=285535 RepID=UPI0021BEB415|nr:sensor domain-containing protein [Streptomyces fulvoviolaceus]MCT9078972.1 hypothetical protein [Streptomyces fulvoviolaceus]